MIFNKKCSKLIAAVLTAALALSPVLVSPISADDGQDVETQASSWRYQDGDIIIDEGLDPEDADTSANALEAEKPEEELLEDYNAQMGSSAKDTEAAEAAEEPIAAPAEEPATEQTEEPATEPVKEPAAEPTEEPATEPTEQQAAEADEAQSVESVEEPAVDVTEAPAVEPVEEPTTVPAAESTAEAVEPESILTAQAVEEKAEAPAEEIAAEPMVSAQSATVRDKYWTWNSGKTKRGPGYLKGIDVSYWQGKIDWAKVKAAGVDFAIIRCGYGANTSAKDDSKFAANVAGCKQYGIPYGVYLYSYAKTVAEANNEADHALRLLRANHCSLQYPVYYDLEDKQVAKASNATIVSMANAFCSKLSSNGYAAGVYANLNWWNNKLSAFEGYDRWVAQWNTQCTYTKDYSIWQLTSSTSVSGISGRVDANLLMCTRAKMDTFMKCGRISYSIKTVDGKKYVVSNQGAVVKNRFFRVGSYLYAFDTNGVMQTNKKFWIGSTAYILDGQGRAYINKSKTKKKKVPYYAKPGSGKVGKIKKKGTSFYVLRTSGKWSQMANGYWIQTSKTKKTEIYPEYRPNVTVKYKAKLKKKTTSRSGPSNKYVKKKKFKKNKKVTVIGTYGGWAKISSGQWLPLSRLKK